MLGFELCELDLGPLTFCMDLTSAIGNNTCVCGGGGLDRNIVRYFDALSGNRLVFFYFRLN